MTSMKKAAFLNPAHFTVKSGEKEYVADLPDGNLQIRYEVFADAPVEIWLGAGKLAIPIGRGNYIRRTLRVADARFLFFRCAETTTVAFNVGTTPIRVAEERDDTPVNIAVPEALSVDISKMVSQLVGEQMREQMGTTEIDIDEIIDDLPEGADPEFGPGSTIMEPDDPGVQRQLREVDRQLADAKKKGEAPASPKGPEAPKPPEASKPPSGNTDQGQR